MTNYWTEDMVREHNEKVRATKKGGDAREIASSTNEGTGAKKTQHGDQRVGGAGKPRGQPNKTEQRFAQDVLEPLKHIGEIIHYWYEPITLRWPDKDRYTPDYVAVKNDGTITCFEVKGSYIFSRDSRVKFKAARRDFAQMGLQFEAWQWEGQQKGWIEIWR